MCRPAPLYVLWFRGSWNPAGSLGCAVVQCVRPVPSELGRGEGCRLLVCCLVVWCFVCGAGEGCRLSGFCEIASLVRAEAPVPSVATSGCPKRSEGGCPCRSEEAHRPSSGQHSWVRYAKARRNPKVTAGIHLKKSHGYRTGQIRVTNSRKSSTSLPCSSRPVPKRVATSALSSNDK